MVNNLADHYQALAEKIKLWGKQLGFAQVAICDLDLSQHQAQLEQWLDKQYHGEMHYMENNVDLRLNPALLHPESVRCISVRMNYLPTEAKFAQTLKNAQHAYVSRYALGRDYHKLMRNRLKQLGEKIKQACEQLDFRPFVDSAPVLERPLAEKAGLGWTGKHSLIINQHAGSWFFLGELLVNIPLPVDQAVEEKCGSCVACLKICPTQAIVAPYTVDARRCISYLTIEHRGSIPMEFRPLMGNRIYGCDDCQLICPWNKYGELSQEQDFQARAKLDQSSLLALFAWTETDFMTRLQGSPIRRIGFECWQRNIAIALGNADYQPEIVTALEQQRVNTTEMVQEHIDWALNQQAQKKQQGLISVNQRLTARLIRSVEKGLPRDA